MLPVSTLPIDIPRATGLEEAVDDLTLEIKFLVTLELLKPDSSEIAQIVVFDVSILKVFCVILAPTAFPTLRLMLLDKVPVNVKLFPLIVKLFIAPLLELEVPVA